MKIGIILFVFLMPLLATGQTETTRQFLNKHEGNGVLTVYFYKNTLRMLNQSDSKEFDEMIKGIEKLRFMVVDKVRLNFGASDYKNLVKSYTGEAYEPMVSSRMDGRNFDVYMKDKSGSPLGTIILVNDSSSLYVMDMIGTIDITKASKVMKEMEKSDFGGKIRDFLDHDKKKGDEKSKAHKEKEDDDD